MIPVAARLESAEAKMLMEDTLGYARAAVVLGAVTASYAKIDPNFTFQDVEDAYVKTLDRCIWIQLAFIQIENQYIQFLGLGCCEHGTYDVHQSYCLTYASMLSKTLVGFGEKV